MTDVEIRPIGPDDDFDAQLDLSQRAFGIIPAPARERWLEGARRRASQGLSLGAFIGGAPAGAAVVHDMRQHWDGQPVPMAGVAGVKIAPEYRGRGIGRVLMTELLALIAGRGYPVSALFPATMRIYRSLGWELAGSHDTFSVPSRSLISLVDPDTAVRGGGAAHRDVPVRRAVPADAGHINALIAGAHRAARDSGPLTRDEETVAQWLGWENTYFYLAGDDGFAAFEWEGETLLVHRVHAREPETLRALWALIASHGTTAVTVRGALSPRDPLWWLTRERDTTVTSREMWMLRLVDAAAAVAARGFPPGVRASVPLEVRDRTRPANAGSWQLTVADGAGDLTPNGGGSSPAPLVLGPRGLAALYAGNPVTSLRLAGLATGGAPEADAALDAAFGATPFMLDSF